MRKAMECMTDTYNLEAKINKNGRKKRKQIKMKTSPQPSKPQNKA